MRFTFIVILPLAIGGSLAPHSTSRQWSSTGNLTTNTEESLTEKTRGLANVGVHHVVRAVKAGYDNTLNVASSAYDKTKDVASSVHDKSKNAFTDNKDVASSANDMSKIKEENDGRSGMGDIDKNIGNTADGDEKTVSVASFVLRKIKNAAFSTLSETKNKITDTTVAFHPESSHTKDMIYDIAESARQNVGKTKDTALNVVDKATNKGKDVRELAMGGINIVVDVTKAGYDKTIYVASLAYDMTMNATYSAYDMTKNALSLDNTKKTTVNKASNAKKMGKDGKGLVMGGIDNVMNLAKSAYERSKNALSVYKTKKTRKEYGQG